MKMKFKIYVALLAFELFVGTVLNTVARADIRPTTPATAEDVKQLRQTVGDTRL